ncbi:CpaF family protein [Achromobacter aloeverae]
MDQVINDPLLHESGEEQQKYALRILNEYLTPIGRYLADPEINEIMINSPSDIWIESNGQMHRVDAALNIHAVDSVITMIASKNQKVAKQILDARLPHLRIAAARQPTSLRGPMICIRRHAAKPIPLQAYVANGAFDVVPLDPLHHSSRRTEEEAMKHAMRRGGPIIAEWFQWVIENRLNVILSGATSAGKTTLLNAMMDLIPKDQRVVTIEDTAELQVRVPNYVSFEANEALGITVRNLVRLSLRARPDRIIVGEVRGAESFDLLDALNTGHSGSFVSFHSDSSELSIPRLESMLRMAPETQNWPLADLRRQIAATFRFVIHAQRVGSSRGPREIREILGVDPATGHYKTRLLFSKVQLEDTAYDPQ